MSANQLLTAMEPLGIPPTENEPVVRIALMSDLHAYSASLSGDDRPSHLWAGAPRGDLFGHPMTALIRLIQEEELVADVTICAGDLGDRGDSIGSMYAWDEVQRVGQALASTDIVATAGNHDAKSRSDDANVWATMQGLLPPFPIANPAEGTSYWAHHFAVLDAPTVRVVLLNSSAYHSRPDEQEHGRIEAATVGRLRERNLDLGVRETQVLVSHHHPETYGDIDVTDASAMLGATALMQLLEGGEVGSWVVLHGHRHYPRLAYASGGTNSPLLFSAGSLTARLYLELQTKARNQFYLIELHPAAASRLGLTVAGRFRAWDWVPFQGWLPARPGSGLPRVGGFGVRGVEESLLDEVETSLRGSGRTHSYWTTLIEDVERLRYLAPRDVDTFVAKWRARGHECIAEDGHVWQVSL